MLKPIQRRKRTLTAVSDRMPIGFIKRFIMHRDKKIGFALGILLVGIVAAFFFRNEPDPFADLPPLDDPATLDAEIAEKPVGPYTDELNPPPVAGPAGQGNPWELPEIYRPENAQTAPDNGPPISPGAPAPINLANPIPAETAANPRIDVGSPFGTPISSDPKPIVEKPLPENKNWTTVPNPNPRSRPLPNSTAVTVPPATQTPASNVAMYQIRPGDTLSVLAEKHLGSSRRYMEIYQANRDILRSPDDIQVGMLIRIPPRVQFSETNPQPSSAERQPIPFGTETLPPAPEEANRFTPFTRSPLTPIRQ